MAVVLIPKYHPAKIKPLWIPNAYLVARVYKPARLQP